MAYLLPPIEAPPQTTDYPDDKEPTECDVCDQESTMYNHACDLCYRSMWCCSDCAEGSSVFCARCKDKLSSKALQERERQ
jgi:hypothetical protein